MRGHRRCTIMFSNGVLTDRTGQSAFCSGPSSSELPQTGCRDPSAAIQQDGGQVCILGQFHKV